MMTCESTTATVGNGRVVHHAIKDDRGIVTYCGAEGRRYIAGAVREVTGRPVSCGRCSDQPAPVSQAKAVTQSADERNAAIEANIARTTESLGLFRGYLVNNPGDAGLIESIQRAEERIARLTGELA